MGLVVVGAFALLFLRRQEQPSGQRAPRRTPVRATAMPVSNPE
jgi:hypothetical protein